MSRITHNTAEIKYPVTEIIGKTIQGEGPRSGAQSIFIRFQYCDGDGAGHHCAWCFRAKTKITMADGTSKNIECIKDGDKILTADLETGRFICDTVEKAMKRSVESIYKIKLSGYGSVFVTGNHKIFVPKRGWTKVADLNVGDEIYHIDQYQTAGYRMKISNPMFDTVTSARMGKETSRRTKGIPHSGEWNRKVSLAKKINNPMRNVVVASKNATAHQVRPTKIEKFVSTVAKNLSIPLIYVGRRHVWINDQNPDFVVKDQNKVIEVYDPTYPRKPSLEKYLESRPKKYEAMGYKCLMLPVNLRYRVGVVENQKIEVSKNLSDFVRNGAKVEKIEIRDTSSKTWKKLTGGENYLTVYNFETENKHTYLANGLLVHNCDTKYTWDLNDPNIKNFTWMTGQQIFDKVTALLLATKPVNVNIVFTGGNPLIELDQELLDKFYNFDTYIETQGTIWQPYVKSCKGVVVSPKPPSSGLQELSDDILQVWALSENVTFKIVIFDEVDFNWATKIYNKVNTIASQNNVKPSKFYLQAGTSVNGDATDLAIEKYRWLVEYWIASGEMPTAVALPQMHVLIWGRRKGV